MRITVHARPRAQQEKVEKIDAENYKVFVKEPPVQGRANQAILQALAKYFKVPKSNVRLVVGHTSRIKIVDVIG